MTGALRFPYSAVVGQDDLKLALELCAIDPAIGGVVLRGQKGSAKTTLARGLAVLLPGDAPFAELPVGATEDRLVGTLDLAAALTGGERRFEAGILAAAHSGVMYVDEVNLLPDHLVDVLLDVAASGVNRVEREGISHEHPARFVLIGSMNPEEGDLRPQLLDRFGLSVDVTTSTEPSERAEAVRRRLAFDRDPEGFSATWADEQASVRARLNDTRPADLPDELLDVIATLCASVGAEGLRADLVIARAAAAYAGSQGRTETTVDDVRVVAPLALAHRRRRGPFDDPGISPEELDQALDDATDEQPPSAGGSASDDEHADDETDDASQSERNADRSDRTDATQPSPAPTDAGDGTESSADVKPEADDGSSTGPTPPPDQQTTAGDPPSSVIALAGRKQRSDTTGRRSVAESTRGRVIGDREPDGVISSVAVGATVRAAAAARTPDETGALKIEAGDLREAVREQKTGNLLILVVDASGSMGAARRMEAVKGAVLGLLLDAYQRRDQVAVVSFRDDDATVALRPTSSVEIARTRLDELPTGGLTPLAAGLETGLALATSARGGDRRPLMIVVSDGRATAAPGAPDAVASAHIVAERIATQGVDAIVIDAETGPTKLGLAKELATTLGARHLALDELTATGIETAVRTTF